MHYRCKDKTLYGTQLKLRRPAGIDHFTENMILREKSMAKLWLLNRSLSEPKNYHNLENHIVNNQTANEAYKTVTMFN